MNVALIIELANDYYVRPYAAGDGGGRDTQLLGQPEYLGQPDYLAAMCYVALAVCIMWFSARR